MLESWLNFKQNLSQITVQSRSQEEENGGEEDPACSVWVGVPQRSQLLV